MKKVSIGFIGGGNHTKRLIHELNKYDYCCVSAIYKPNKSVDFDVSTDERNDLLKCDVIFITSPNSSHFGYLEWLANNFRGFIFCEKPPVNDLSALSIFERLDSDKTFFGFNFRYSEFSLLAAEASDTNLIGQPLSFFACVGYGFAYKPSYVKSWKSDEVQSPLGVVENLGIHYLDLAVTLLGKLSSLAVIKQNVANTSLVSDSATMTGVHGNGATSSIFVSYATPLSISLRLIGTNGTIEYEDDILRVKSPRDTFDDQGLFVAPPVIWERMFKPEEFYLESLRREVQIFIEEVVISGKAENNFFDQSKEVTRFMLENS